MSKRPLSISLISFFVFLLSVGLSIRGIENVVEVISIGRGPLVPALTIIYIQLLWSMATVAAVGLWIGAAWSRHLLVGVLLGLFVVGLAGQDVKLGVVATQLAFYFVLTWRMYCPEANAFFGARQSSP